MIEQFLPETTREVRAYVRRDFYCCDSAFLRCGDSLRSRLREIEIGDVDDARRRHFASYFRSFVRLFVLLVTESGGVLGRDCEWMVPDSVFFAGGFPADETSGYLHNSGVYSRKDFSRCNPSARREAYLPPDGCR